MADERSSLVKHIYRLLDLTEALLAFMLQVLYVFSWQGIIPFGTIVSLRTWSRRWFCLLENVSALLSAKLRPMLEYMIEAASFQRVTMTCPIS